MPSDEKKWSSTSISEKQTYVNDAAVRLYIERTVRPVVQILNEVDDEGIRNRIILFINTFKKILYTYLPNIQIGDPEPLEITKEDYGVKIAWTFSNYAVGLKFRNNEQDSWYYVIKALLQKSTKEF